MKIETAVVPVAGWGTRLLPVTQLVAKEFLPLGRKPAIQHIAEELCAAGVRRIIFVVSHRKESLSRLFVRDGELAVVLSGDNSHFLDETWTRSAFAKTKIEFVIQEKQLGLGHAVLCAQQAVGSEPFLVALGDCLIGLPGQSRLLQQMQETAEETTSELVIGFDEVPYDRVSLYGIAKPGNSNPDGGESVFKIEDLIEKPATDLAPSNLAICGRYLLPPAVFDELQASESNAGEEIQLTDAIARMIRRGKPAFGVRLPEGVKRYDIGSLETYARSFVEFALADSQLRGSVMEAFSDDQRTVGL